MSRFHVIAGVIVCAAAGFTMWAFSTSMTPYVDVQTALRTDTPVQVRGRILRNTSGVRPPYYDTTLNALCFWIEDDHHARLEVVYHGAKPDAFDTAPETAAHGTVRREPGGNVILDSDSIVVKCPSKYDDRRGPYQDRRNSGSTT